MEQDIRFVGLDAHADSIAAAVVEVSGTERSLGTIPSSPEAVRKLMKRLGPPDKLRVCYEAGPTGYVLYRQLTRMGIDCQVIAPTLVPTRPGDRVKTDRRDALKLARSHRNNDLTSVWSPDEEHEALRDLVRAREAAASDQTRARHRLSKFLLRQGCRAPQGVRPWTQKYLEWVRRDVKFDLLAQQATLEDYLAEVQHAGDRIRRLEHRIDDAVEEAPKATQAVIAGLQALRGVAKTTAVTVVSELGRMSRFARPQQLMGYTGVVSREHSSGSQVRRGGITKTGNAHLRRIVVEAAWSYRHRPNVGRCLSKRHNGLSAETVELAWKARHRLHQRYRRLLARGKQKQQVVTAVARELLGFIWDIGVRIEQQNGVAVQPIQPAVMNSRPPSA